MSGPTAAGDEKPFVIRTYREADRPWLRPLYDRGRLAGQVQPEDGATDMEDVASTYLADPRTHFWVADLDGRVIGMVGVVEDEPHRAQVRRLRVDPEFRERGVALELMRSVLGFCRRHDYLKVVLDTGFEHAPAIELFDRFAFQHHRTRRVGGKEILEFYIDLYREPRKNDDENKKSGQAVSQDSTPP